MTARRPLLALLLMAASAGPAAVALEPGSGPAGLVFLALATLAASAQVLPRPARVLLRPALRRLRGRTGASAAVPAAFLLASASGFPAGSLLVALLPSAGRAILRRRWSRDLRTARDATAVALLDLLVEGSAASFLGTAAAVLLVAAILPGILAGRSGGRPRPAGRLLLAGATAALAAVLFVGIPRPPVRSEEPASLRHRERRARQESALPRGEGLVSMPNREVRLGEIGTIQMDHRPRLEVTVLRGGRPAEAADLGPLFRGGALEEFDGRAWSAQDRRVVLRDGDDGAVDGQVVAFPRLRVPAGAERIVQRLRFLSSGTDTLYCLGMPYAVGGPGVADGVAVHPRGEVRSVENYAEGAQFTLVSYAARGATPVLQDEALSRARREALLAIPADHARVRELARSVAPEAAPPGRGILRALDAFLGARCTYTLEVANPRNEPPVEAFLFTTLRGHCELYASAAALLLRARGIPARVAIGFRGGVFDPVTMRYTLRGADAHAWVEAWFEDEGWVTFDPTPSADGTRPPEAGEGDADAAASRRGWLDRLLRFDGAARDRLLADAGRRIAAGIRRAFLRPDGGLRWQALALLSLAAALLAAARILRRRRADSTAGRPSAPDRAPPPPPPEAYALLVARLSEAGVRRGAAETAREHAGRALRAGASPTEAVHRVVAAYEAERWGGRRPGPEESARLVSLARAVAVGATPPAGSGSDPPRGAGRLTSGRGRA